ncbi:MAG: hypothetical protein ACLFWG_00030 [Longimicrobiales bacterium]
MRFGSLREIEETRPWWVVCGQGPSWANVDVGLVDRVRRDHPVAVIAVNGAVEHVPAADYWFTLDPSRENLDLMRDPVDGVRYVAAVPDEFGTPEARHRWQRPPVPEHVLYLRRVVAEEPTEGPFEERVWAQIVGGMSEDPRAIHTGNSGFGALQLACLLGAERVTLLGIDGHGRERWDGSPNFYLGHLPHLFRGALPQLQERGVLVANGSPESFVDCFPRLRPRDALAWLVR